MRSAVVLPFRHHPPFLQVVEQRGFRCRCSRGCTGVRLWRLVTGCSPWYWFATATPSVLHGEVRCGEVR
jgi:hypothetical protein